MNPRPTAFSSLLVACLAGAFAIAGPAASKRLQRPSAERQETPAPPSAWRPERGGFSRVTRLHPVGADSVWAVGSNAAHFDGGEWRARDRRDVDGELTGVSVLEDGYGWIVGDNEEVVPVRDGIVGSSLHVPGYRFRDVAVVAESAVWALAIPAQGSGTSILRNRNGDWLPEWTPPDNSVLLESLWMHSATEGWAVGNTAVHYDGTTWTEWPLPEGKSASSVSGSAPNDVWAVGGKGNPFFGEERRWILRFDGTGWAVVLDELGSPLRSLTVRGDEGYAISWPGHVFALRGGTWLPLAAQVPAAALGPPYVTDVRFVPGASYALATTNYGWIYRLEEDVVSGVRQAGAYSAVAMLDDRVGWAVGERAAAYDGTQWRELPDDSPLHGAVDVTAASSSEAWAVGGAGQVVRFADGGWSSMAFPFDLDLRRVVSADGVVWALGARPIEADLPDAGEESVVVTLRDAAGWTEVWRGSGAAMDLAVAAGRALVATDAGVSSFDGRAWAEVRSEGAESVGIGPNGESWVGIEGKILSLDGSGWTAAAFVPGNARVRAFHTGASAAWAVADYGYVLAFADKHWRIVRGAASFDGYGGQLASLLDATTVRLPNGEHALWVVGQPDTILRSTEDEILNRPAVTPAPTWEPLPTGHWSYPQAYFPSILNNPSFRDPACRAARSLPETTIAQRAVDTARHYAAGGPAPEPRRQVLGMMTAAEVDSRYGVALAGIRVGERTVTSATCVWWAVYTGWFDAEALDPPGGAREPDFGWTRLELAMFPEDATVFYEGFAGRADSAPPTSPAPPLPTGVATPPAHSLPVLQRPDPRGGRGAGLP